MSTRPFDIVAGFNRYVSEDEKLEKTQDNIALFSDEINSLFLVSGVEDFPTSGEITITHNLNREPVCIFPSMPSDYLEYKVVSKGKSTITLEITATTAGNTSWFII
jgi:hypothetical protein